MPTVARDTTLAESLSQRERRYVGV